MAIISTIFHIVLYQPFLNALMVLYRFLGEDMGIAIIVLTLIIKLVLFYPSLSQLKAQRSLQKTQPKLKELKEKYKDDKEGYSKAVLAFYKENKVNPLSSCLPLLIQLPILIALYQVFIAGVVPDPKTGLLAANQLSSLYEPVRHFFTSTQLHTMSLGLFDVAHKKNLILAFLAAAATYWQSRMLMTPRPPKEAGKAGKDEDQMTAMNRNMVYFMPLVTFFFAYSFPTGLALYWLVSTLFQVLQQWYFLRRHPLTAPPANVQPK
ncbi:MAG: YidC/Oxa1 family membrane protein insertase [bacterium]